MRLYGSVRWTVAPAVLALAVLSGCGEGASDDGIATAGGGRGGASPSPTAAKDPQDAMLQFARCMRANGVNVPDPSGEGPIPIGPENGDAPDKATMDKARKACEKYLPDIGGDGPGRVDPKMQDRVLKFARCMREQGIDMPDPDFRGDGAALEIPDDPSSDEFKAAQQACKQYFGAPGVRAGTS